MIIIINHSHLPPKVISEFSRFIIYLNSPQQKQSNFYILDSKINHSLQINVLHDKTNLYFKLLLIQLVHLSHLQLLFHSQFSIDPILQSSYPQSQQQIYQLNEETIAINICHLDGIQKYVIPYQFQTNQIICNHYLLKQQQIIKDEKD